MIAALWVTAGATVLLAIGAIVAVASYQQTRRDRKAADNEAKIQEQINKAKPDLQSDTIVKAVLAIALIYIAGVAFKNWPKEY